MTAAEIPAVAEVPGRVRRPGRPRSERADRAIMDATVSLFAESGAAGLCIEKVAARAAVASNPHTRTVSRPLVLMTTPRSMAAGQQGQACQ